MVLRFLLEKEVKQLFRNPILRGMLVFYTLIVLFFFPWTINQELKELKVTIVNTDQGQYAQRFIGKLQGTPTIQIQNIYPDYPTALKDIERQESLAIIVLPEDFSQSLERDKETEVQVLINSVDGSQAGLGQSYLTRLIQEYSSELRVSDPQTIEIKPVYKYNGTLDYQFFMLPALLVIMITLYSSIFPAMSIVVEKERGTLQQINVTPVKRTLFILGKIIPFWVISVLAVAISVPIIYWVYGLGFQGSFLLYLFSTLLFCIGLSFMGVILSNLSETIQQAMFLTLFFILIFFLVSGLFTPVNAMPLWGQAIAYANPLTYFIRINRMMYLRGAGFMDIYPDLIVLIGFIALFSTVAVLTHNKRRN